jgi:N-acyl-D-amino-acid deacylase
MVDRRTALWALAGVLVGGPSGSAGAPPPGRGPAPAREPEPEPKRKGAGPGGRGLAAFDAIMNEVLEQHGVAGGSLAIAKDGRLVLARGYGLADVEARRPVTPETLFCIASVTKALSAVAALRLADQGKLDLEARLADLLADLHPGRRFGDPRFRAITVHHLLYHASGIPDRVKAGGDEPGGEAEEDGGTDEAVAKYRAAAAGRLDFAPGTEHHYSNSGFLILRLAIERAAGRPYVPFVREEVLRPMGIHRIVMEAAEPRPGETVRYLKRPKGLRPAPRLPHNWLATPTDLVRFLSAVAGSGGTSFLAPATYRLMVAPPPPPVRPGPDGRHVGLGWDAVRNTPQGDRFSKNGGKAGVSAWAEHFPNGVDWAFMINTTRTNKDEPNPAAEITRRVGRAIESHRAWPDVDLFRG